MHHIERAFHPWQPQGTRVQVASARAPHASEATICWRKGVAFGHCKMQLARQAHRRFERLIRHLERTNTPIHEENLIQHELNKLPGSTKLEKSISSIEASKRKNEI